MSILLMRNQARRNKKARESHNASFLQAVFLSL